MVKIQKIKEKEIFKEAREKLTFKRSFCLTRGQQTFPKKGQRVVILDFESHMVFINLDIRVRTEKGI